jgi:pilus assembly protein Flp/PilA
LIPPGIGTEKRPDSGSELAPLFLGPRRDGPASLGAAAGGEDDSGATAIEYALIASLIAVALVTILTNLGAALSAEFSEVSGALK